MKKISAIQIAVGVIILVAALWWWMSSSSKPGNGMVIVTPMPMSSYSIEDDVVDADGIPGVVPAAVTAEPKKEMYGDMQHEGYAVYDAQVDKDWMIHPEQEGYEDYSPTEFKSDLLD